MTTLSFPDATNGGFRWIVGDSKGPRSNAWILKGNKKGDMYLTTRSLGGILKASFHKDGKCQIGYTKEYAEEGQKKFGGKSRHWDKWTLPKEPYVRIAQIVIPASDLSVIESQELKKIKWLPAPDSDFALVVSVFIAEPPNVIPLDLFTGALPLASFAYATRTVWVVAATTRLDAATITCMDEKRKEANSFPGASAAPLEPNTKIVLWGTTSDKPHDLFFYELGWK